jgi:hypothetical protein
MLLCIVIRRRSLPVGGSLSPAGSPFVPTLPLPPLICYFPAAVSFLQLNNYIIGIIRQRRAARAASGGKAPAKADILDRILISAEVSVCTRMRAG